MDWGFNIDRVQAGDQQEIDAVNRAMASGGEICSAFFAVEDFLPGLSREEKFVNYLNRLKGVGPSAAAAPPPSPGPPLATPRSLAAAPASLGGGGYGRWTSSESEKRKRKGREDREEKEDKKEKKRRRKDKEEKKKRKRKETSSTSTSTNSSPSSSSSEEERERRKRRKRKEKRKKRKSKRREKKGKGKREGRKRRREHSESSSNTSGSSGDKRTVKPRLHLTKDRSPEPKERSAVQYFIRNACKLYVDEWSEWTELKKNKELMNTFQRDIRANWRNGDALSENYINRQAQRVLKDHRYHLKSKVKSNWDPRTKTYVLPENMNADVFKAIVDSLVAGPGTPSGIRDHQGDARAHSEKKPRISNMSGQGGYPHFESNFVSVLSF